MVLFANAMNYAATIRFRKLNYNYQIERMHATKNHHLTQKRNNKLIRAVAETGFFLFIFFLFNDIHIPHMQVLYLTLYVNPTMQI